MLLTSTLWTTSAPITDTHTSAKLCPWHTLFLTPGTLPLTSPWIWRLRLSVCPLCSPLSAPFLPKLIMITCWAGNAEAHQLSSFSPSSLVPTKHLPSSFQLSSWPFELMANCIWMEGSMLLLCVLHGKASPAKLPSSWPSWPEKPCIEIGGATRWQKSVSPGHCLSTSEPETPLSPPYPSSNQF